MKQMLLTYRLALLLMLMLTASLARAYDFMVDGLCYNRNSDGTSVTVTYQFNSSLSNYYSLSGAITIPATVTDSGTTYSVTSIGGDAFLYCSGLTSVTIPNSVTSICYDAFGSCTGLTSVTIPNSVTSIGIRAFSGCSGLTSVTIPNSVTTIDFAAFNSCRGLTSVTIGNSVKAIGDYAFAVCSGLTSVDIPNSVTTIGSNAFSGCSGLTSVTIPNSVTSIGSEAFRNCIKLTSVTIPNSVTSIGSWTFGGCSDLTSVTIGNSVTTIGGNAFYGCSSLKIVNWNVKTMADFSSTQNGPFYGCSITTFNFGNEVERIPGYICYGLSNLTSVTIGNSVTSIGENAFYQCSGLTSITVDNGNTVYDSRNNCNAIIETASNTLIAGCKNTTIPNSVTSIGNYAFWYCSGLTSVDIPNSVTSIGFAAFVGCSGLTSVTIPNSVTSIGSYAFYECSGLTIVVWNAISCDITEIPPIGPYSPFNNSPIKEFVIGNGVKQIPHYLCNGLTELTSVTIPNSVTSIGSTAFSGCSGLTSVTIGNSVTEIGEYAFGDCSGLTSVTIPNSVTSIGGSAFDGCRGLTEIISLPLAPPRLGSSCFNGVDKSIPVYVLDIPAYQSASGWKDFTNIVPLGASLAKMTVQLPADFGDGRYKDCYVEVVHADGSTHHRCLVTDQQRYSFTLANDATYHVTVKNALGVALGEKKDIKLTGEETTVAFASLKRPHKVSLAVTLPDGVDVTERVSITWSLDSTFVAQGPDVQGLVEGMKLTYTLKLPGDLAAGYVQPQPTEYTVKNGNNDILVKLQPFSPVSLSGVVADAGTGSPLMRATVTVSQTLNGRQSRSVAVQTDGNGNFELEALNAPGTITASAGGYVSRTIDLDEHGRTVALDTLLLAPITGVVVNVNLTHRSSVKQGESATTEDFYTDYANVAYTIRNTTQNREVTQFNVQYPEIVLLETVNEGDVLQVNARSLAGTFADVAATCRVAGNSASVTLPIVDYGGVAVTADEIDATKAVGMLYDSNGEQLRRGTFGAGALQFDDLPDGSYTLVAMQQSSYLNDVLTLAGLTAAGLQAGTDFARQTVTVWSGIISEVNISRVPALDETSLYYTGGNTYFSASNTSVTIGRYVALTARVDFKNAYQGKTKNVQLLFDLPQGCDFVEQSVLINNEIAAYTRDGQRIIVGVPVEGGQVKFCVIPTQAGEVSPAAAVQFTLNGNLVTQPIGSATFEAKALDIWVPSVTATPEIAVSGAAPAGSAVGIYDNDVLIGKATATAGGIWDAKCTLVNSYNLSSHQVQAKATITNGMELLSQNAQCVVDKDAAQVSKVTMYYNNSWDHQAYKVIFDYLNPIATKQYWPYYPSDKKFTFTIEFDGDSTSATNVVLHVKTTQNNWRTLETQYDENQGLWVAVGDFDTSGGLPVNVAVSYDNLNESKLSAEVYDASINYYSDCQNAFQQETANINEALEELNTLWNSDDYNSDVSIARRHEIYESLGIAIDDGPIEIYTDEEMDSLLADFERVRADSLGFQPDLLFQQSFDEINAMTEGFTIGHCTGMTEAQLIAEGYEKMEKDDGTCIFIYFDENTIKFADLTNDICYELDPTSGNPLLAPLVELAQSDDDFEVRMNAYSEKVGGFCESIKSKLEDLADLLDDIFKETLARSNRLENNLHLCENQIKYLKSIEHQTLDQSLRLAKYEYYRAVFTKELAVNKKIQNFLLDLDTKSLRIGKIKFNGITGMGKYVKLTNKLFVAYDIYSLLMSWKDDIRKVFDTYFMIPNPCTDDEVGATIMRASVISLGVSAGAYYTAQLIFDLAAISSAAVGTLAALPTGGTSLSIVAASIGVAVVSYLATEAWNKNFDKLVAHQVNSIKLLSCYRELGLGPQLTLHYSKSPDAVPTIDPSGYVYEAVPSNRLQGATATIYYKETVEDMWGQPVEREVMWDAAEYAQQNPLFTDENGMYQWDVPQGLWQVRFTKAGYEPTQSEWLPVPPPQLDVNIGMTQLRQPEVAMVHAYSDGVELAFDKYMRPSTLTGDNIRLTYKGKEVESSIEMLDAEAGDSETYARKVLVVPATEFAGGEVTLTVLPAVESYAGVTMNSAFEQAFGIERRIRVIAVDSVLNVGYGESREVKVSALPLDIAAGRTLRVATSQPVIASVESGATVTLDKHGMATLTVAGNLPGATALTLSVDGFDLRQQALVNVVDESSLVTATPVANEWNGKVFDSMLTVELTCDTEGAEIWYTTDGSCPCDPESRQRYTGPITITGTTTLKAIAQAPGHYESDIATYYYFKSSAVDDVLADAPFRLRVADGGLVVSGLKDGQCQVHVFTMGGNEVLRQSGVCNGMRVDLSRLSPGVYVAVVVSDGRPTAMRFVL